MAGIQVVIELMQIAAKCLTLEERATDATRDEAQTLAQEIQDGAPVLSGFLRDSVNVTEEGGEISVNVDAEYAGFVEYGTSTRAAHPFVEPAIERARVNIGRAVGEKMWTVT